MHIGFSVALALSLFSCTVNRNEFLSFEESTNTVNVILLLSKSNEHILSGQMILIAPATCCLNELIPDVLYDEKGTISENDSRLLN